MALSCLTLMLSPTAFIFVSFYHAQCACAYPSTLLYMKLDFPRIRAVEYILQVDTATYGHKHKLFHFAYEGGGGGE
jgi:hypothetical protein